ncbi:MAG: hypothetical protein KDA84_02650, partial [Planctomycetaceae bacterium]|nr:hypothetical protein [Planctomycetaceae bacterium]
IKDLRRRLVELQQCPCCDYFTLEERADWDICPVCFWEDAGQDLDRLDDPSSCNHGITLREGRENFARLGAYRREMLPHVCTIQERQQFRHEPRHP